MKIRYFTLAVALLLAPTMLLQTAHAGQSQFEKNKANADNVSKQREKEREQQSQRENNANVDRENNLGSGVTGGMTPDGKGGWVGGKISTP